MKDVWLNFLTQLHTWCAQDTGLPAPRALEEALTQLHQAVPCTPRPFDAELSLWRQPLGDWWDGELPPQWDPTWRVLSRQLWTLTAEALAYLERYRPGAVAAPLPWPSAVFAPPSPHPNTREASEAAAQPRPAACSA
jgi:hypothetical protein